MANTTPSVKSRNKSFVVAVIETAAIVALVIAGAFYAGYQFKSYQDSKTKAAVQDALKAAQPAPVVAEAPQGNSPRQFSPRPLYSLSPPLHPFLSSLLAVQRPSTPTGLAIRLRPSP
jgi:hypothetical protein